MHYVGKNDWISDSVLTPGIIDIPYLICGARD